MKEGKGKFKKSLERRRCSQKHIGSILKLEGEVEKKAQEKTALYIMLWKTFYTTSSVVCIQAAIAL